MSAKAFAVITALGGSCVGSHLYFLTSNNSSGVFSQSDQSSTSLVSQPLSIDKAQEKKSFAQGKCDVISLQEDISKFLDSRGINKEERITVSCKNTSIKSDYTKLPPEWVGWFPKFMFSEKSNTEIGQKVEINTEAQQEESNTGSYTEVTFSGSGLNTVYQGAISEIEQQTLSKKVSLVSISVKGQRNSSVYLFLPKLTNEIPED